MTGVSITLKLFASLMDYLPAEARRTNALAVEVAANTTIDSVIAQFHLPRELCHLVVVNGEFVVREERPRRILRAGDTLATINVAHDEYKISFNLSLRHLKLICGMFVDGFTIYDAFYMVTKGIGNKDGVKAIETILNDIK